VFFFEEIGILNADIGVRSYGDLHNVLFLFRDLFCDLFLDLLIVMLSG